MTLHRAASWPSPGSLPWPPTLSGGQLQALFVALDRQSRLLGSFIGPAPRPETTVQLTARETAVLALLVRGHTATGIAGRLTMSPPTATKHIEHIYRKLDVGDRLTAARVAAALGADRHTLPTAPANRRRAATGNANYFDLKKSGRGGA